MEKYKIKNTDSYYRVKNRINEGGFGNIYECDICNEERKIIQSNLVAKNLKDTTDFSLPHRFDREMRYIEQLKHENIMKPIHCDYDNEFIIMKRYPYNLEEYLNSHELDEEELLTIFIAIVSAMKYCVSEGILHRDLKPHNILVTENGKPILSDFGLSAPYLDRDTKYNLTETHFNAGTKMYSAPEQLNSLKEATEKSEVYSLGVILYTLYTKNFSRLESEFITGIENSRMRHIIKKATKQNSEERYETIDDLYQNINDYLNPKDDISIQNFELDYIAEKIYQACKNKDTSQTEDIFNVISNVEFDEGDNLLVKVSIIQHLYLMESDSDEYNTFIIKAAKKIVKSSYTFSYVDTIVRVIVDLLTEIGEKFEIETKVQLINAAVMVSSSHNRFYAMTKIGDYINELEDKLLLDDIIQIGRLYSYDTIKNYSKGDNIDYIISNLT